MGEGAKTAPVVRAGDIVRLWRQESSLRIEVAGVSEESGGLGKTIRVRLLRRNTDDQSMPAAVLWRCSRTVGRGDAIKMINRSIHRLI